MRRRCCCGNNKCSAVWTYSHNPDTCETTFTSHATASPGCTVTSNSWSFFDGSNASGSPVVKTFDLDDIPEGTIPWAKLTVNTSCGQTCELKKDISIPCEESIPGCPGIPKTFLATFSGMPSKTIASITVADRNKPIEDPSNRLMCIQPNHVQGYWFADYDFTPLNGSYEFPTNGIAAINGFYSYLFPLDLPTTYINRYWPQPLPPGVFPPQRYLIELNDDPDIDFIPCYCRVLHNFGCASIGPVTRTIIAEWHLVKYSQITGRLGGLIGKWQKDVTLPPGVTLMELGQIELDPVVHIWGNDTQNASMPRAWGYPYSDPCGFPPEGTLPNSYPLCFVDPNG